MRRECFSSVARYKSVNPPNTCEMYMWNGHARHPEWTVFPEDGQWSQWTCSVHLGGGPSFEVDTITCSSVHSSRWNRKAMSYHFTAASDKTHSLMVPDLLFENSRAARMRAMRTPAYLTSHVESLWLHCQSITVFPRGWVPGQTRANWQQSPIKLFT